MDKITKLSQAIRYGSTFLGESRIWTDCGTAGCALGTAYMAVIDRTANVYSDTIFAVLSKRFNVPVKLLGRISKFHYEGKMTRAQCADWLEQQGY